MKSLPENQIEELARQVESHADFKVLRRLKPQKVFRVPDGRPLSKGIILDTETTGLSDTDKIIELALVVFEYDPETGEAYRVLETYDALEDPGAPLHPAITKLTGITDEMVVGQRIDDGRVAALVEGASIVIAHHAAFDRPFVERRFTVFDNLPWACSLNQVDWTGEGFGSRKLDYIAFQMGFFFGAHRAETDCLALLAILQQQLPGSKCTALKILLDHLPLKDWTVYALNSPYETKDVLKSKNYRWDAERKVWHCTVTGTDAITNEVAWLKETIYGGRNVSLEFESKDALLRFSKRPGKKSLKTI